MFFHLGSSGEEDQAQLTNGLDPMSPSGADSETPDGDGTSAALWAKVSGVASLLYGE